MTKSDENVHLPTEVIPVFSVAHRGGVQRASHPDHKGALYSEPPEEVLNRIGSALRRPDGSVLIHLAAFPVNGQVLLPSIDKDHNSTGQKEKV